MAGLFPSGDNQKQNTSASWPTIPLHIVPEDDDYTLQFLKPCKLYDELYVKQIHPKIYNGLFVKYAPLIQYLKKYSGANLRTFTDFNHLYDTLNIEKSMGFE